MSIKKQKAFTLLEILISMALSSFVIFGLMQSYQNLMRYLERARGMVQTNRKVCLLFNQLERDITSAFIQLPHAEIKPAQEESDLEKAKKERIEKAKKDRTKIEKEEERKKRKEELSKFFLATTERADAITVKDKKLQLFGSISFVTTNSLQVFGQKRVRYVRVRYELKKDKDASMPSYSLIRKETTEIKNHQMKETGFAFEKVNPIQIRTHVVADGIKFLSVEYVSEEAEKKKDEKKKGQKKEPKKEVRSFTWGDKEFSQGFVPRYVEVHVEFWKSDFNDFYALDGLFPILSYPTPDLIKQEEQVKEQQDTKPAGLPSQSQEASTQGGAAALNEPSEEPDDQT